MIELDTEYRRRGHRGYLVLYIFGYSKKIPVSVNQLNKLLFNKSNNKLLNKKILIQNCKVLN